jgi:hypothetical protein
MQRGLAADIRSVARILGLPLLLGALVIGGYLLVQQLGSSGPTAPAVTQAETQAQAATAAANFREVTPVLSEWYVANGTYAGAALPPGSGVELVRADATSYCLQTTGAATATMHETGPNGSPQPGPC